MKQKATNRVSMARSLPVLQPLIVREYEAGTKAADGATEHFRKLGELLLEGKEGHPGEFVRWVEQTFPFSIRSAQHYMRLANTNRGSSLWKARSDPATRRQRRPKKVVSPEKQEDTEALQVMGIEVVTAGHRALAMKYHPDKPGGSVDSMTRLNRVREVLVQCIEDW